MEMKISLKKAPLVCRVCLTQAKDMAHLNSALKLAKFEDSFTVSYLLETVTNTKLLQYDKNLPSHLCQTCLCRLRLSFTFLWQFRNSQTALEQLIGQEVIKDLDNNSDGIEVVLQNGDVIRKCTKITKDAPPPDKEANVELVIGGKTAVDLRNVLVVEEDVPETCSYDGFLNNLGHEISATFVESGNNISKNPPPLSDVDTSRSALTIKRTLADDSYLGARVVAEIDIDYLHLKSFDNEVGNEASDLKIDAVHICSGCNQFFHHAKEVKDHMRSCPEYRKRQSRDLVCEICGHVSLKSNQAYHHMNKHKGRRFKCPLEGCGKSYYTSTNLKIHTIVHTNERPFLCNFCAKSFQYMNALQYHMRLHTGEKKYVCNFCGLRYTMPQSLTRHIRTHTKEKPYRCCYCDKTFCSSSEQTCHERVHTKTWKYFCEYCNKGFIKSFTRLVHYMSHPGPHECSLCPRGFVSERVLDLHIKKAHKDDPLAGPKATLMSYESQDDDNNESS